MVVKRSLHTAREGAVKLVTCDVNKQSVHARACAFALINALSLAFAILIIREGRF